MRKPWDGGADDDELFGELGNDSIKGGSGADIILGDVGQIIRAFNDDGSIQVNARGDWQRDIVLEEIGYVTDLIDIDTTKYQEELALAEKILQSDLVVLTGAFNVNGSRVHNIDNGAWDTGMLLIDLVTANNDSVDGGDGDDIIIGQRGDDTLSGGSDSDLIIGDNASSLVQYESTFPQIIHGVRLIGAESTVPLELDFFGSVIVPDAEILPQELTLDKAALDIYTNVAPELQDIASNDALRRTDGASITPFISIVPDLSHHVDILYGNDIINGGEGDDQIFGDNLKVTMPQHDTFKYIDKVRGDVNAVFADLQSGLQRLALDYSMVELGINGVIHNTEIHIANDIISGDAGNDTIVGDNGIIVVPASVRSAFDPENIEAEALAQLNYLWNVNHLVTDFKLTVQLADVQLLDVLVEDAIERNPQQKKIKAEDVITLQHHDVIVQNDVIQGNEGNDLIIGDHGVIITPVISSKVLKKVAFDPLDISRSLMKQVKDTLKDQHKLRDNELHNHIKDDHLKFNHGTDGSDGGSDGYSDGYSDGDKGKLSKNKDLKLISFEFSYERKMGNDALFGDDGEDIIIGDHGFMVMPAELDTPVSKREAKALNKAIDSVLKDVDALMREKNPAGNVEHRYFNSDGSHDKHEKHEKHDKHDKHDSDGSPDSIIYNDTIDGGEDNDVLFGDSAAIKPVFEQHIPADQREYVVKPLSGHGGSDNDKGKVKVKGIATAGDDIINTGSGNDIAFGQNGNDIINGEDGDDLLYGGSGKDTINGNAGNDKLFGGSQKEKFNGGSGGNIVKNGGHSDADDEIAINIMDKNRWIQQLVMDTFNAVSELDPNSEMWQNFGGSDGSD